MARSTMEELVKNTMRELTRDELCDVAGGQAIDLPDWANLPTPRPDTTQNNFHDRLPWFPPENYRPKH